MPIPATIEIDAEPIGDHPPTVRAAVLVDPKLHPLYYLAN